MKEKGVYYYYVYDIKGRPFGENERIYYCFHLGNERYIPHELKKVRSLAWNDEDIEDNRRGGYNFVTTPVTGEGQR